MSDEPKCETCRYWLNSGPDAPDAGGYGTCRRFPPIAAEFTAFEEGGMAHVGRWPDTASTDWCGEHKPRE